MTNNVGNVHVIIEDETNQVLDRITLLEWQVCYLGMWIAGLAIFSVGASLVLAILVMGRT